MYNDIYEESQESKVEISLVQAMLISITVLVTLIIPTQFIQQSQVPSVPDGVYTASALRERDAGQVAGIETEANTTPRVNSAETEPGTTRTITFPIINYSINLDSETGVLVLSGTVLIIFALLLIMYSIVRSGGEKKRKR